MSDYIPRLRSELLRAAATEEARRGRVRVARGLRPLAAAAAVLLVALAVVLALPDGRGDETAVDPPAGAVQLGYRVEPSGAAATEQAAQVMRERLLAAGIPGAGVAVSPSGDLTISAPAGARADVTALTQDGRLAIYDWERSVLGPGGVPEPADASVTGGADAGRAEAITKAEAEARAARRPGAQVVRALSGAADGWFALGGDPALTNSDIARARPADDPVSEEPVVTLEFTARGESAFTALTRELARRGGAGAVPGGGIEAAQHLAIVLDGRIVGVPFIDFRQAPTGIAGSAGTQISGGLTPETARRIAALLSAGPLSAELVPVSEDTTG